MSFEEERLQILKMLEEGKITAEEAAQLLSALNAGAEKEQPATESHSFDKKKRRVRISVTDAASGKQKKVNINLPVGIVKIARKMGAKFSSDIEGVNIDEIFDAIDQDMLGKVVDIQADDEGKRVEIFVE